MTINKLSCAEHASEVVKGSTSQQLSNTYPICCLRLVIVLVNDITSLEAQITLAVNTHTYTQAAHWQVQVQL